MATLDEIEAGEYCPSCDELIPEADLARHLDGRDLERIECPRQDITLIREDQEGEASPDFKRADLW